MLPKKNRLKAKYIKNIFEKGIKYRGEYGMLIVQQSPDTKEYEIGFVVSKKIGNAVQRHKMTRLLREISRDILKDVKGRRYVYVAFKYSNEYESLEKEFSKQFKKTLTNT